MASVTQKIPNYVMGISAQPDEQKLPGQVVDLVNGVPDVVKQLIKRPGSNLITTLSPSTAANTKWFDIYTDDTEQYIGQVGADGAVLIWRCSDGASIPVDYADIPGSGVATYLDNTALSDEKSSDIQVMTVNQTTFFCNRRKATAMETGTAFLSPPQINEAFIELDSIAYGKQYALDIYSPDNNTTYAYSRATGIVVDESISSSNTDNGDCQGQGREYVTVHTGTAIGSTSPPNASSGGKSNLRYEMDTRCTPVPNENDDDHHDSYQPYAKLQFGGEGWTTNDTHQYTSQKGITTTVTIKNHVTVTSRANIALVRPEPTSSNAEEHVSAAGILGDMKATLDAISSTGITCTIVGNGLHLYSKDPFGVTSPERNLVNVVTSEANNIADLPRTCRHGYTVRIVNSGEDMDDYYLKFQAEGIDADIVQTGTYARSGSTVTVTTSAAHGLANGSQVILDFTSGAATDGFYTIASVPSSTTFTITDSASGTIAAGETVTIHPARFGEGVWEEVAKPGIEIEIDKDTMPLKLVRVLPGTFSINGGGATSYANGAFRFGYPDWGKRDVGDDITNSKPTFIGNPIQNMTFFRNRIALLSEENVILSRVNDYYNFWVKTAMAISNADPIDLQSSSTFPTTLYDAVESNTGLVLFSANEQFLLSSGAEALLTPETAKIGYLSSYAFNSDTKPVSLGTTIGFLNSTAKNARFYELANITNRQQPDVMEQSKIIDRLFPANITQMSESNENQLITFGVDSTLHTASNEIWGYKYYQTGTERKQSAWFRWTLPNNVVYHTIMDDVFYAVLNTGSTYTFESFDIRLSDTTLLIGTAPDDNRVHLDTKKTFASGDLTYNTTNDTTTFTLGAGYYSSRTLTAYCITDSDAAGKSYDIQAADISGSAPNQTVTLPGNWKTSTEAGASASSVNTDVVIGYEYEFEVELPKIYMLKPDGNKMKSETRGSLVIHRMNFDFGDVGVIDVTLKRKGRSDYTYTVESLEWDNINASTAAIADGYIHTIPAYERNTNLNVLIKSNHPSPATIYSMNWEGDYSPRYYQRV
tara:strand:- start:134 stop:3268 length:3135 start_codon:yes stop_codon:yes gene_type:complete